MKFCIYIWYFDILLVTCIYALATNVLLFLNNTLINKVLFLSLQIFLLIIRWLLLEMFNNKLTVTGTYHFCFHCLYITFKCHIILTFTNGIEKNMLSSKICMKTVAQFTNFLWLFKWFSSVILKNIYFLTMNFLHSINLLLLWLHKSITNMAALSNKVNDSTIKIFW